MSLPNFSVKNSVLVNMMMLVILIGGGMFALTLTKEMFPESRPNKLMITAIHPGVQPEEIEKAITIKVEEAVRDVDGIEKVDSSVQEGYSTTVLTLFNEVKNVDAVLQEVKHEIDARTDFPSDLEKITVKKLEPRLPVISVAIFGDGPEAARKRAARKLRDELLLLPGVTDVQITGTRNDEISVEVRPGMLQQYNVTFDEIAAAIRNTNLDVSGGQLKGRRSTVSVRTLGEKLRGRDLEDIVVKSRPDGSKVYLKQVAVIRDTFVESDLESYFRGKPGVNCTVYKSGKQDVVQIANTVRAFIAGKQNKVYDPHGFNEALDAAWYWKPFALVGAGTSWLADKLAAKLKGYPDPADIYEQSRANPFDHNFQVALHSDLARFVEGRLDLLTRNGKSGLVLVLVSLIMFLNWRVAIWAAVGIPVAFFGTFVVMWALGVSINLLSMFGLIIVLGIIVDDAIVIGENIYRHTEEGSPPLVAAVKGAEEVMWPVIIAVTTTIAAFAPLFFIKGQVGDFMGQLPIVVMSALTVSLLEALIILPAHLAHLPSRQKLLEKRHHPSRFARFRARLGRWQERWIGHYLAGAYEKFLRVTLKWRYVTLATAITLLLIAGGMVVGEVVDFVFIQKMDSETLICSLEMPVGTPADQVRDRIDKINKLAKSMPEVVNIQAFVAQQYDLTGAGVTGMNLQSHLGQIVIELRPADARERDGQRSSMDLLTVFREESAKLAGMNSITWQAMVGGPGGKDIHLKLSGAGFDELVAVSEKLKKELEKIHGVFDLDDDVDSGQREIQLTLNPGAREAGVNEQLFGGHVRSAVFGREARRITRNREDVKIMVRYPRKDRQNVNDIEALWIPVTHKTDGTWDWAPIGRLAKVRETRGYATIHRSQQSRSVSVLAEVDTDGGTKTQEVVAAIRKKFNDEIHKEHPGVRLEFLGQAEEMAKAFSGLKIAFPVALLLIFMMLAGLFRSYIQPLVVMSAIPFGLLGAVVGHWVTNNPITILSLIGMVALTGITVNDSLVLVDFINSRIRNGEQPFEASIQGAKLRLRAILLTTLTTVAGLTPLMFETSFQAKFLIPMAVTLTWGLSFATLLTLVLVPTLNMIFFDVKSRFKPIAVGVPRDPFERLAAEGETEAGPESPSHDNGDGRVDDGNGSAAKPVPAEVPAKS
jgi:hydrophobic/amphiphilic exporter-1 (mainly G- bacteria), HAE1 family